MEENKHPAAPSFFTPKNIAILVGVGVLTVALYLFGSGTLFKASILDLSQVPAFNGTVRPINKTLNWAKLSSQQFADFKSGALNFDNAGDLLVDLPDYDPNGLCNPTSDPASQQALKTFVTAYMGKYTSGTAPACENAGSHVAVDIRGPKLTPVYAVANGMVSKKESGKSNGNVVCVKHPNVPTYKASGATTTYTSCYLHMDSIEPGIEVGTVVTKGQQIGKLGTTGTSTTFHVHFQLDKSDAPFDPYWPFTSAEATAAGLDFFSGVNEGLGKDKGLQFTENPMEWVEENLTFGTTASVGTTDVPLRPSAPVAGDQKKNENIAPPSSSSSSSGGSSSGTPTVPTPPTTPSVPVTPSGDRFTDVPDSHPNQEAIYGLRAKNVLAGNPDGTFKPDDPVNRAAMCKIALLAYNKDQTQEADVSFSDVSQSDWFYKMVRSCVSHGIFKGYADNTYRGGNSIQWPELAVVITRLKDLPEGSCGNPAGEIPPWAEPAAGKICKLMGFSNLPMDAATRAQVAESVWRTLK